MGRVEDPICSFSILYLHYRADIPFLMLSVHHIPAFESGYIFVVISVLNPNIELKRARARSTFDAEADRYFAFDDTLRSNV